jgi:hypothetical protein
MPVGDHVWLELRAADHAKRDCARWELVLLVAQYLRLHLLALGATLGTHCIEKNPGGQQPVLWNNVMGSKNTKTMQDVQRGASRKCTRGGTILTVAVESVHPRKGLLAALACERPDVQVQVLVPLAVVLARKALLAPWPLAVVRLLLVVRAQVT